ncbi:MAG: hypothetical protein ACM3XR_02100 [Bacillota bacterium]
MAEKTKAVIELTQDILSYILRRTGAKPRKRGDKVLLNPCPICGHKDHFYIYLNTNSYYSFSGCCGGGTLVDWLMEYEGVSLAEAMRRVHGDEPPPDKQKENEIKKLANLLNEQLEGFFNACVLRYRLFKNIEADFAEYGIEWTDWVYRWIRQGVRFYDRVLKQFIEGDYPERVKLMRNHDNEYFYKLNPAGVNAFE